MNITLPKELVLNGTDNDGVRHRYSFDKTPKLKEGLKKLFLGLEFEEEIVKDIIQGIFLTKEEEEETATIVLSPEQIYDRVYYLKNSKYELDLFFGKNKVILLVRTKNKRMKLVDEIEKKSSWISKKEIEKRQKAKKPLGITKKISKPYNQDKK
jgi:hypothetical protein